MKFQVSNEEVKRAQTPHNLFIFGVFLFNLMLPPAIIGLKIGLVGVLIPLFCNAVMLGYIYLRSRKTTTWFVDAHWRLSLSHGKWLMLGYAGALMLFVLAWLVSLMAQGDSMERIMMKAMALIALVPAFIGVLVSALMEGIAFSQATKREVSDGLVKKFPPPATE